MPHRRHARDIGIPGIRNRHQLIKWLRKRDGNSCSLCGRAVVRKSGWWGPSIDHVIPLSKGGQHCADNVKLAHTLCNNLKGDDI